MDTVNMQTPFDKNLLTLSFLLTMNLVARFAKSCPALFHSNIPPIIIESLQIISYLITIAVGIIAIVRKFKQKKQ